MNKLVLLLFLALVPSYLSAVVPQFRFDIFSQEDGLPNNQIQYIYQDSKGWLWVGTSQGLSRFDGYDFVNFMPAFNDSLSLRGNLVRVIKEDRHGNLLVGTENGGLNLFNRNKENFSHPFDNNPNLRFRDLSVNDIATDADGKHWLGTEFTILILDTTGTVLELDPIMPDQQSTFEGNYVRILQFDNKGILWIGTNNGVFTYNPSTNMMKTFDLPYNTSPNREIWEIYKDDEGYIWIGTYSSGLFLVDPVSGEIKQLKLEPEIERTETVRSISKGAFGEFWIGTRGGLYIYSKTKGFTGFFRHDEREPYSISNNSVLYVYHDNKGETWIGTRGGLNLLAKSKQVFHNFGALPGDNKYLNSNTVYAFWIDKSGKIWIGTEDGGINIYNPVSGTFEYITAGGDSKTSISENCIKAFHDDGKGNLWVGTFLGGVDVINLKNREVKNYKHTPGKPGTLSDNRVWDICSDKDGGIWVSTTMGIDKYDPETDGFISYPQLGRNSQVLWIQFDSKGNLWAGSMEHVVVYNPEENSIKRFKEYSRSMYEDAMNRIWITTLDKGIALYNSSNGPVKYYNETNGLANNQALCVLEDDQNNLWISTNNGLSKFNTEQEYFRNFTNKDGLSNNQFCYGAAYKTESGDLLFGSISGFNIFNPSEIVSKELETPLVLTGFKIFNKTVPISDGKKSVLSKSISETERLVMDYKQNVFTVEFAALNYVNSSNNLYTYILEGFNKNWNEPSKIRSATYTNLNPGNYVLRIKQVLPGVQNEKNELRLDITVLPPFWKTTWFLTLFVLATLLLIYVLLQLFINREKMKNQLVMERVNARKLHELDMLKLKFFTNISHEIRTPLTLILGPLEKLKRISPPDQNIQENLTLIHRNAQNLSKLVNQLLDFRKLQSGNLKLNLTEADLIGFIRNIVNSFDDYAKEKQVKLKFTTLKKRLFLAFDPDVIEKILNNLLSNAFKFTDEGGTISVNLSLVFDSNDDDFENDDKEKQFVEIIVKDTGKGISESNVNKIFMRFFQVSGKEDGNSGAGIGLALVKELVALHKGNIFVASKPGKGTKFTLRIPLSSSLAEIMDGGSEPATDESSLAGLPLGEDAADKLQLSSIMLVVDDNPDVRQFIKGHFKDMFKIIEAKNGEEAWDIALNTVPDIIISDILMPNVDGYEFCKRIKTDERTSHIPVLLLTAMHSKDHELKGLTTGADDYITKPFDLMVLQAKVENVLSIRKSLMEKYSGTVLLEPKNVLITSPDERFLHKAIEVVEQNISDSELDIEAFSEKVGVSRMQLYRKLHALTNMTVKEFIRHIRLKRAAQLLSQQKLNVSEVAYEVGFKDLSHFRKCFKREFGMNATDYVAFSQNNPDKTT